MTHAPSHGRALPAAAYIPSSPGRFLATELPRGPWDPAHQHGGPPVALACRAIEAAAGERGLGHIARLTANLLRPVPLGELSVEVKADYVGRSTGHFSASVSAGDKELVRITALAQRESAVELPESLPGHPLPMAPCAPEGSPVGHFPFAGRHVGYADLVETRIARGAIWQGPCAVWFRLRYPLVAGEAPSPYARVAVAADSGNGISAVLEYDRYLFLNPDLTINLLRKPVGEWVCLDARTALGPDGCGLAESALYDERGFIGRATQSLAVRQR